MMARYRNEADCLVGFKKKCAEPGSVCMERRGQTLLQRFRGVELADATKQAFSSETSQAMNIDSLDELQTFENASTSASAKFVRGFSKDHACHGLGPRVAEVDYQLNKEDISAGANVMKVLVQRDLEKKAVAEEDESAMFLEQACRAAEEAKATSKEKEQQKKAAAAAVPLDKVVEKLGLSNAIATAESQLGSLRIALVREAGLCEVKINDLVADIGDQDLKDELAEKVQDLRVIKQELEVGHVAFLQEYRHFVADDDKTGLEYKEKATDLKDKCKAANKFESHIKMVAKSKELKKYRDDVNKKLQEKIREEAKQSVQKGSLAICFNWFSHIIFVFKFTHGPCGD